MPWQIPALGVAAPAAGAAQTVSAFGLSRDTGKR
jgi:hypothetical protein